MLEKKWLCSLSKMVSWSQYVPFIISYLKGGEDMLLQPDNVKCAWKGSEPELVASIAFKKKGMNLTKF
jgi:hypothetical protein